MTIDVLDYLGKWEGGVISFISLGHEDEYYDATFFYTEEILALTIDEVLENKLGCKIEDWVGYTELMLEIIKKVVPYSQIINQIDDFKPDDYDLYLDKN